MSYLITPPPRGGVNCTPRGQNISSQKSAPPTFSFATGPQDKKNLVVTHLLNDSQQWNGTLPVVEKIRAGEGDGVGTVALRRTFQSSRLG